MLPLSAINTSPVTPAFWIPARAFSMQRARVSASFKHGMTIVNSVFTRLG